MKYGLIGKTLKHSYSKLIHEAFKSYTYDLLSMSEDEIPEYMKNDEYAGFNVTIPYKETIIPYCDELSCEAEKIGSVNTVVKKNGKVYGYNTDYAGFEALAKRVGIDFFGKKVVILGSGGTYKTVYSVVSDRNAREIISVSRKGRYNYDNIEEWCDAQIIVNTTPVGMYPDNGLTLLNLDAFHALEGVIDVIYNPLKTKLVYDAEKKGIKSTGGLYMLVFQAKEAYELFLGKKIPDKKVEKIYNDLLSKMTNIVFIGMPGSGKSTAGRIASEVFGRELIDIDALVEKNAKMSIPDIFDKFGEAHFRNIESECAEETGKLTGKVISCGGGIIKKSENLYPLAQNGKILWIKRDLNLLATDGRPLSKDIEALKKMEVERTPLYESFADEIINNDESLDILRNKIKNIL